MSTRPRVKGGQCVRLTTLSPSCAECLEIWEPRPSGTLRACSRSVQELLYLLFVVVFSLERGMVVAFEVMVYSRNLELKIYI